MPLVQSLITKYCNGLFVPSWEAAKTNIKSWKKPLPIGIIQSVNVIKTCDELRLAVTCSRNELKLKSEHSREGHYVSHTLDTAISLHIASNICFGMLRIYNQQVNFLWSSCKDLGRSSTILVATKQNSASKKKRSGNENKVTFVDKDIIQQEFLDLYNDAERLALTTEDDFLGLDQEQNYPPVADSQSYLLNTLHTITEPTVFTTLEGEEDEIDLGCPTDDELTYLIDFLRSSNKDSKNTDILLDAVEKRIGTNNIGSHTHVNESPLGNRNGSNSNSCQSTPSTKPISINGGSPGTQRKNTDAPSISCLSQELLQNPIRSDDSSEHVEQNKLKLIEKMPRMARKRKAPSGVIIDKCIKISDAEILKRLNEEAITRKSLKLLKRRISSRTLLNSFCRSNINDFKIRTLRISRKSQNEDFTYVFPNICRDDTVKDLQGLRQLEKRRKRKNNNNSMNTNDHNNSESESDLTINKKLKNDADVGAQALYGAALVTFANNEKIFDDITQQQIKEIMQNTLQKSCSKISTVDEDPHHPFIVLLNLIYIWRFTKDTKINTQSFCSTASNRVKVAQTFCSLLTLAAEKFIVLMNYPDTGQVHQIEVGSGSEVLLTIINGLKINDD